jgi:hypothetical protein
MELKGLHPLLLTDDVAGQRVFVEHVGFEERFRSDWRVSLVPGENEAYDLAFIAHEHETIPENDRPPTSARLLNFEIPGVQHAFDGLRAEGVEILQPLKNLPAGQRHFICRARTL